MFTFPRCSQLTSCYKLLFVQFLSGGGLVPFNHLCGILQIKRVHSHGMLTLDQIHALNDKLLVNLFANLESNELTRNFTYTCWLVPNCQQTFSSFGNETKSKAQVKAHLRQHIATLRAEAEAEGKWVASSCHRAVYVGVGFSGKGE